MDDLQLISYGLNDLENLLGVKEEIQTFDLLDHIIDQRFTQAADLIAKKLDLPVKISIELIEEKNKTPFGNNAAEVIIPSNLPTYGSDSLNNFPIHIRLSTDATKNPDSFIAIVTHELSHILLASIKSPLSKEEKIVDLCPILLGFRDVIRRGRNRQDNVNSRTIYGYLTDEEFNYAYNNIGDSLSKFRNLKSQIIDRLFESLKKIEKHQVKLSQQINIIHEFDKKQERKIRKEDLQFVVDIHRLDSQDNHFSELDQIKKQLNDLISKTNSLIHYGIKTEHDLSIFQKYAEDLCSEADTRMRIINNENKKLLGYLNFFEKIRFVFLKNHST